MCVCVCVCVCVFMTEKASLEELVRDKVECVIMQCSVQEHCHLKENCSTDVNND